MEPSQKRARQDPDPGSVRRVLSIQSHVVHGYVGNRAAVFPLQLLGFEVDVVNSVQFSCHTGYPRIAGGKLNGEELRALVDGLEENGVLRHSHLLTGYMGTASFLREVICLRRRLPPACRYICDPVMGDNGKLYVAEEVVAVYREEVLPHVTVLTPNQFEAELLTETKISDLDSAARVCDMLHGRGPRTVVLTTLDTPDATEDGKCVAMVLSEAGRAKWLLRVPFIAGGPFTGTGDLTASMLLAWTQLHAHEMPLAVEKAAAVLQSVISRTVAVDAARTIGGKRVPPELRIIESKRSIEDPAIHCRCHLLAPRGFRGVVFSLDGAWAAAAKDEHGGAGRTPSLQPGARDCVLSLRERGVRLGALAGGDRSGVDAFLERAGLPGDTFGPVVARDAAAVRGEPGPGPVLRCCEAWGVDPASVLVVGDGCDALRAGRAAGCATAAFLRQGTGEPEEAEQLALLEAPLAAAADFGVSDLGALGRLFS